MTEALPKPLQSILAGEIVAQCDFVSVGALMIDQVTAENQASFPEEPPDEESFRDTRLWFGLQAVATSVANLSKLLWESDKKYDRQTFRDALGVDDSSSLKDRNLRNDLEHIDQRMIGWWKSKAPPRYYLARFRMPSHIEAYIDGNTVKVGTPPSPDMPLVKLFRRWTPNTATFTFWDHDLNIQKIVAEVAELRSNAKQLRTAAFFE